MSLFIFNKKAQPEQKEAEISQNIKEIRLNIKWVVL